MDDRQYQCWADVLRSVGFVSPQRCLTGLQNQRFGLANGDGGRTWIKIDLNVNVDLLFVFYSRGMGYIGGAGGLCWSFRTDHLQFVNGVHISRVNVDVTVDLRHCRFYDAYLGVVVGVDGVLRVTLDGGLTWLRRDIGTTLRWNNVCIVDSVLFVVGDNGCIYRSIDLFYDASFGLVVGRNGCVLRTVDGGLTWTRININIGLHINALHIISRELIFAVRSWCCVALNKRRHNVDSHPHYVGRFDRISFNSGYGWVVGRSGAVYAFTDDPL
ncbi:MAG: hypothetical protein IPP80_12460 [Ignavibacteria bacterium]|nr:hypothetical protein [Ignavibacteria bacterium]